jgi:hypothetical protein
MSNIHVSIPSVDKELDRLVKELIENDLALRAVINEVEILIFTSTLLPQRYQSKSDCFLFEKMSLLVMACLVGLFAHLITLSYLQHFIQNTTYGVCSCIRKIKVL